MVTPPPPFPPHPVHQATDRSPFGHLTAAEFHRLHGVCHSHATIPSPSDPSLTLFTQSWRPSSLGPLRRHRGLVFMLHGLASESGWLLQLTAVAFARLGFLVFALDLPRHGLSSGRPRGFLPRAAPVVDDCLHFFSSVRRDHQKLPAFLYGESFGGAIALLVYLRRKEDWSGIILNGAMFGISKRFKPPWPLELLLPLAAAVFPRLSVTFTRCLVKCSYKDVRVRRLVRRSPNRPRGERPAMATSAEVMRVAAEVQRRCGEVEAPVLVVHGGADAVCDAASAGRAFGRMRSADKTMRVFPGMWHQLVGEEDREGVDLAFGVIFSWLLERAAAPGGGGESESELDTSVSGGGVSLEVVV